MNMSLNLGSVKLVSSSSTNNKTNNNNKNKSSISKSTNDRDNSELNICYFDVPSVAQTSLQTTTVCEEDAV